MRYSIQTIYAPLALFAIALSLMTVSSTPADAARCTDYNRCEQAVRAWCEGRHRRADGDGDGIPCENVCRSRSQVRDIQRQIGCRR